MKNKKNKIICSILAPIIILALNANFIINKTYINGQILTKDLSVIKLSTVKNSKPQSSSKITVRIGGQPIGIKLNTDGVLVVGFSDIISSKGKMESPAAVEGIQIGDVITKINNQTITSSNNMSQTINKYKGGKISVTIKRNTDTVTKNVVPVKSINDESYKLGLWIRDRAAGVGTLTFYDEKTGKFAALGHPITDIDTGTILKVGEGNLVDSTIISVKKGLAGNPGEVRGIFINEDKSIGKIEKNTKCGIYGSKFINKNNLFNRQFEVALRNEVKIGKAQILTTINNEKPKLYDIYIDKLLEQDSPGPKSMIIRVTDKELLEKTGGIVQGMSGSPIIQDNKIVGAVTHVLINKPDVGYGIYIEWMLKDCGLI